MQIAYELPENTNGTFEVYNMIGEKLFSYSLYSGKNTFSISRSGLNEGIYFYRAIAGNKQIAADKIVVIK
ncbi:MAG: T9SS type A sorting domain-containing protein [Bacteroidota bacterium]